MNTSRFCLVFFLVCIFAVHRASANPETSYTLSFNHGVSCGVGTTNGNVIIAWVSVNPLPGNAAPVIVPQIDLQWQVATDASFSEASVVVSGSSVAHAVTSNRHRAAAQVSGLQAGQCYFYRFILTSEGLVSPTGSFITPLRDANEGGGDHVAAHIRTEAASTRRLATEAEVAFKLLHINDQHNRVEGIQASGQLCTEANEAAGLCLGGFGRLATFIGQQRSQGTPTLVLDAGDQSTGTLWDVQYRNHSATAAAQKQIGFHAMTLGNHEFDNGIELLSQYLRQLDFPALGACNIDTSLEPSLAGLVQRWTVTELAPGIKVGIIGYHTLDTTFQSGIGRVKIYEIIPSVQRCVQDFKAENPDVGIIVGLSHAGYLDDLAVAAAVPDLDLIVGGHSHTFLYGPTGVGMGPPLVASKPTSGEVIMGPYPTFVTGPSGRQVPVLQAACWSKYVGVTNLRFSSSGDLLSATGSPVLMGGALSSSNVPRDPAMLSVISQYSPAIRALEGSAVGVLGNALTGDRLVLRLQEAPLGNLITDALLWFTRNTTIYKPHFAIINSGGLRAGLPQGNVTSGDLLTVMPFGDTVIVKEITGLALLTALENGVASDFVNNQTRGAFPQVSGLRFTFNSTAPRQSRVTYVEVRDPRSGQYRPLDPCAKYIMVTGDYVAGGGDGYTSIKAAKNLYKNGPGITVALTSFFGAFSPITRYTAAEGRINRCDPAPSVNPPACAAPPTLYGTCAITFTLLHYNDMHARVTGALGSDTATPCTAADEAAGTCFGGFARLSTYVKSVRDSGATSLLLDAGDMSTGSSWDIAIPDRKPAAAFQNALGVAAFTVGNHEFDLGAAQLVSYLKQLTLPVLGCNVNASAAGPALASLIQQYTVVELGTTGVRAAIIGWVTPDTATLSPGGREVQFLPVVPSVQAAVAAVKADFGDHIKIIIGLSHGGYESDLEVAAQVGDIDIIIGGHNHYFMYGTSGKRPGPALVASNPSSGQIPDGPYPVLVNSAVVKGKKVLVMQEYFASRYLGQLVLRFNASGDVAYYKAQPVLLGGAASSNPITPDPWALNLISSFAGGLSDGLARIAGSGSGVLSSAKALIRSREAALGDVVCDAMRWAVSNLMALPAADVCLFNGGGIRADLPAGNITVAQVTAVLPYGNTLTLLNVTGAQLLAALENGVSGDFSNSSALEGRFPQVSGMQYTYDGSRTVGRRVLSAAIITSPASMVPIDPCKYYTAVVNDYMAGGGDGYSALQKARVLPRTGFPADLSLMKYVAAASPLPTSDQLLLSGRITACGGTVSCPDARAVADSCGGPASASPTGRKPATGRHLI